MVRITGDQVHLSTANLSALGDAEAQLAEAEAQLCRQSHGRCVGPSSTQYHRTSLWLLCAEMADSPP
jgi:hypothetical protein